MTLQTETVFLEREGVPGLLDTQIFSFSRLAWRVLQESGGLARTFFDRFWVGNGDSENYA